ncbi:hypothetical protein SDC9_75094 [bioreactor metagenome]|uniref:Uncharacterized protein n=1 Tax=bioreactor metagenome TaxID=1076179 RepID=A0A644YKQ3_9ZZZZ
MAILADRDPALAENNTTASSDAIPLAGTVAPSPKPESDQNMPTNL